MVIRSALPAGSASVGLPASLAPDVDVLISVWFTSIHCSCLRRSLSSFFFSASFFFGGNQVAKVLKNPLTFSKSNLNWSLINLAPIMMSNSPSIASQT